MAHILRDTFINKIRELNYHYKSEQLRTHLYRRAGTTDVMFVPKKNHLNEDWVKGALRDAGLQDKEIREFLAQAKT